MRPARGVGPYRREPRGGRRRDDEHRLALRPAEGGGAGEGAARVDHTGGVGRGADGGRAEAGPGPGGRHGRRQLAAGGRPEGRRPLERRPTVLARHERVTTVTRH